MSNWLDSSNNANSYKSMYVNGFIDISGGNIQTRNADNHLLIAGDSSFNSNLSLGKDLSIGIENPQYAVDISGTVDLKDNLLMRGDISLNKNLAAQNAGTLENHNYSEPFDDYDNLILKTDQTTAVDTATDTNDSLKNNICLSDDGKRYAYIDKTNELPYQNYILPAENTALTGSGDGGSWTGSGNGAGYTIDVSPASRSDMPIGRLYNNESYWADARIYITHNNGYVKFYFTLPQSIKLTKVKIYHQNQVVKFTIRPATSFTDTSQAIIHNETNAGGGNSSNGDVEYNISTSVSSSGYLLEIPSGSASYGSHQWADPIQWHGIKWYGEAQAQVPPTTLYSNGILKVRSWDNGWSEETINNNTGLSPHHGDGGKSFYLSGDGNVVVVPVVYGTDGQIYMWIRDSITSEWNRTIIIVNNSLVSGTPSSSDFNNYFTGSFGGVALNYDGTRIAFSNNGETNSHLFVFSRTNTTISYIGGVQISGVNEICRCVFTKTGDKLFAFSLASGNVKIYTVGSSSLSLTKTITTTVQWGQGGINKTGTRFVVRNNDTTLTVYDTTNDWTTNTNTSITYPSSRAFALANTNTDVYTQRFLELSSNGNTVIVSGFSTTNQGKVGVYDISDLNSISEIKYLDDTSGTTDNWLGTNVHCSDMYYAFTAGIESSGNYSHYNVFQSYNVGVGTNYYNREFKGGNLFLNGNLTIDGTLSVGAINATGNTITYDADTTMNKRLYVNSGDISMNRLDDGFIYTGVVNSLQGQKQYSEINTNSEGMTKVALSADASYALVGARSANNNKGKIYFLKNNHDGTWTHNHTEQGSWAGHHVGQAMAITKDGEHAVYVRYTKTGYNLSNRTNIYFMERNTTDDTWSTPHSFTNLDTDLARFICIQKRDNGEVFAFYNTSSGAIEGYKRWLSNGNWSLRDTSYTGVTGNVVGSSIHEDNCMKINDNCTRLIVCRKNGNYKIYDIGNDCALTQIGQIEMSNMTSTPTSYSEFARHCGISGDGTKIIVSAYDRNISIDNNTHCGIAQVFVYVGGGNSFDVSNWSKYGPELYGSTSGFSSDFGRGIALNTDGTMVVGSCASSKYGVVYKYRKITQDEWTNSDRLGNDITNTNPILLHPGASWDENTYYWYQYGTKLTNGDSHYGIDVAWANNHVIFAGNNGSTSQAAIWNIDMLPTNVDLLGNYNIASNINTSGTFFADVSLNHNLVVPGNITIVDGSANNYGAYTTFTNKDATAYFNVGKSASNVFNIVDKNNVGVYMASDGNSMTSTSDERLKTEIESLDDPTEKLMQLKPCTYKWKSQEDDKKHVGFIAQEVEEVLPELVNETTYPNGGSYKGVAMSDLIPYLIKSIQERQLKIDDLKRKYA